jgi:acyl-CoA synthetase (AMP-forming)/AMP-acid ligase II
VLALARHPLVDSFDLSQLWLVNSGASPAEIMRFVAGEVAYYKQIRRLEVIDAIPKSAAGKILRRVLRDSART